MNKTSYSEGYPFRNLDKKGDWSMMIWLVPQKRWRSRQTALGTKRQNYTITHPKHSRGLHKQLKATIKHTHFYDQISEQKRYEASVLSFLTSVVLSSMASHANLQKRREALTRCYVTSHWHAVINVIGKQ